ncbi:MAG TPA: hypothetical protein VN706_15980 [Gemmatimonadaceae bacterium]|nr:hypothetical protein [Gemmatimonadaceae bacterium]
MSDENRKRVSPNQEEGQLDDATLESVAGGCEMGTSIQTTVIITRPIEPIIPLPEPIIPINPIIELS